MQLRRELAEQLGHAIGRQVVDDPVGVAALDLGDGGLDGEAEALHDAIDVAGGLRGGRPDLEVRVAPQHELPRGRVVGPVVRPGAHEPRDVGADLLDPHARRQQGRRRQRELLQPLRLGAREVERDLVAVQRDAALERAGRRLRETRRGAVDRAVERLGGRAVHLEEPLEREADVGRLHARAVGVAHAAAQRERPRAPAVERARQARREVGDDAVGGASRGLAERRQPVLRHLVEVPVLLRGVDLRVGGSGVGARQGEERAAAMPRCGVRCRGRSRQREQRREDGEHAAADR